MSRPKYVLCPGKVRSKSDGGWHYITARELAFLYGVPMDLCLVMPTRNGPDGDILRRLLYARAKEEGLMHLGPRISGDYRLAEKPS